MPRYASPQGFLLAALIAGSAMLGLPPSAAAQLDQAVVDSEQQACLEAMGGEALGGIDGADRICGCMADSLSNALDDDAYEALSRLIHLGEESAAGLAALAAAKGAVAACLGA